MFLGLFFHLIQSLSLLKISSLISSVIQILFVLRFLTLIYFSDCLINSDHLVLKVLYIEIGHVTFEHISSQSVELIPCIKESSFITFFILSLESEFFSIFVVF